MGSGSPILWTELDRGQSNPEADKEEDPVELKPGDKLYVMDIDTYLWKMNIAMELAIKAAEGKKEKTLEEMLPPHYLEYREVFEKKDFDTLPERQPWDHIIKMTPDFKPTDCKVYPLTGDKQKALKEFLDKNLHTKSVGIFAARTINLSFKKEDEMCQ